MAAASRIPRGIRPQIKLAVVMLSRPRLGLCRWQGIAFVYCEAGRERGRLLVASDSPRNQDLDNGSG
jgi:hypothetical protein